MLLPTGTFNPSAGRTTHQDGEALKNLALKKRSIQSRKLWGDVNCSCIDSNRKISNRHITTKAN
ncbi:hypothetical protein Q5738_09130 [Citrobacter werkmanii]|uniref:hypothetical protein n=1 Tax=Citrobacter werkmanii TaxID=67827 RepID=UPI002717A40A|nr:hypothetical protein [Citrobacter werkmanii]MDO8233735.1 hypothetical protein [Citrobacter werkmanii]